MLFEEIIEQLRSGGSFAEGPASFREEGPLALYGAGNIGRDLREALAHKGCHVTHFLDRKATPGQVLDEIPVFHPDDAGLDSLRGGTKVIVSIFNPYVDTLSLLKELRQAGWRSAVSLFQVYDSFAGELGTRFWLGPLATYRDQIGQIREARELWTDEKSRRLYETILALRLTGSEDHLPVKEGSQYFPADVPPWPAPLRLVDCGAFDGDSLRAIRAGEIKVKAIAAFEPDEANFRLLVEETRDPYFAECDITCLPCGVHAKTTQFRFSAGLGTASGISAQGENVIQCVALDDCLPSFKPTLLKMDIEGAEYEALQGASRMVAASRPGLAICVYHRPDDLWRIPLLVRSWNLDYRFYLRNHAYNGFELVLYALPAASV